MYILKFILFSTFILVGLSSISAQKVLQVEKVNSLKTTKYYVGDYLIFKREGERGWRTEKIVGINLQADRIVVESGILFLDEITYILPPRANPIRSYLASLFGSFGLTTLVYTVIDYAVMSSYNWLAFYAGIIGLGVAVISYYAIPLILKQKIGKRYRLRLLDLTFYGPQQEELEKARD